MRTVSHALLLVKDTYEGADFLGIRSDLHVAQDCMV
jgi:hypothetical protein